MAKRKRITAAEWLEANPRPTQTACDHCGTVIRALQRWPEQEIKSCGCACHWAKHYDKENKIGK